MAGWVASSGTLVSAVLESAGFHYQAYVLESLREPFFKGSVGGFIYLIGVVVAVFHTAIRGGYKFGPWLIIGPPLFFAMVLPTDNVSTSFWKFGQQGRNQARVERELTRVLDDGTTVNTSAKVSKVFLRYNTLVSETVQEIVKILNRDKTQTDRWFVLRAQLFGQMQTHLVAAPGLKQLIQHALFSRCGELVSAAQIVLDENAGQARKEAAARRLREGLQTNPILFNPNPIVAQYLLTLVTEGGNGNGEDHAQCIGDARTLDALQRVKLSCPCVWNYVFHGILRESRRAVMRAADVAEANEIRRGDILAQWANALRLITAAPNSSAAGAEAATIDRIARAIGKYILRNESSNRTFAGFLADSAEKAEEFGTVRAPLENNLTLTEYARLRQQEWTEKTRLMTTAGNLPYYQGLLLFFLAFAFPFFALLLLVPGKHAGFLQWFVLWLWVKSWDIGFAVVMQLDDILFSILNLGKEFRTSPLVREELQSDFTLAMYALRQHDPTFQMGTYYGIIAMCLSAIPIVTSQFILGSLSGGAGIISQGMKMLADDFAQGASNTAGQQVVSTMRHQLQDNIMARSSLYYANVSQYRHAHVELGPAGPGGTPRVTQANPLGEVANIGRPRQGATMSGGAILGPMSNQSINYGPPNSAGRDSNRSLENLRYSLEDVHRGHRISRTLQGLTGGAFSSNGQVNITPRLPLTPGLDAALDVVRAAKQYTSGVITSPLERIYRAQADYYGNIGEAHIDPISKWAIWDAYYSEEGQRLAAMARLYNMLEVPWTASETPEIAEGNLEFKYLEEEAKLYAAHLEAMGNSAAASLDWTVLRPILLPGR